MNFVYVQIIGINAGIASELSHKLRIHYAGIGKEEAKKEDSAQKKTAYLNM